MNMLSQAQESVDQAELYDAIKFAKGIAHVEAITKIEILALITEKKDTSQLLSNLAKISAIGHSENTVKAIVANGFLGHNSNVSSTASNPPNPLNDINFAK